MDENIIPINMQQEIADEVVDTLHEEAIQEVNNELNVSAQDVRDSAARVLAYAFQLQAKYNNNMRIGQQIGLMHDELTDLKNFQSSMVQTNEEYKELMSRVLDLQNKANGFLGTLVRVAFVSISGSGKVQVYEMKNTIDHWGVSKASSARGGALAGRIKAGLAKDHGKKMMKTLPRLDATFKEVYQRSLISKKKTTGMHGAFYIFWKPGNKWERYKVTSKGTLGESYFAFFINEFDNFADFIEQAIDTFMREQGMGVMFVDNASGFLRGDVSKNGVEYAVKATGASAMGYIQIVKEYAEEIFNASDLEKYLLDLKNRLDGVANQAKEQTRADVGKEGDRIIEAIRKRQKTIGINLNI